MKHLPLALIYSRLAIGGQLLALAWLKVSHFAALAVGLLTDVFDSSTTRCPATAA